MPKSGLCVTISLCDPSDPSDTRQEVGEKLHDQHGTGGSQAGSQAGSQGGNGISDLHGEIHHEH